MAVYRVMNDKIKVNTILKHFILDGRVALLDFRTASCYENSIAFLGIYGMMSSVCTEESCVYLCFEI